MAWNLSGHVTPLLAAVISVPVLISGLGVERFGALTICWMVIGYFGLFDLGIGRALTKLVAENRARNLDHGNPLLIWTALWSLVVLGFSAGVCLWTSAAWLVIDILNVPEALHDEAIPTFRVLGATLPFVFLTAGLRGVIEAHNRFDWTNVIRIPMGLWTFFGPLLVLPFSVRLDYLALTLGAGRVIGLIAHAWGCGKVRSHFFAVRAPDGRCMLALLSFGGWMTVSYIVGPIMVYFDRFVIGALLTMTAVAYYATPYEIVSRLSFIPDAIVGVLFPVFSSALATDRVRAARVFERGQKFVFMLVFPPVFLLSTLAYDGLRFWIGDTFAAESSRITQWLCVGLLANAVAKVPYGVIQASGRADLTAKLHLVELPLYLLYLWVLISTFGLEGAAVAWTLRATVDMVALLILAWTLLPTISRSAVKGLMYVGLGVAALCCGTLLPDLASRVTFSVVTLIGYAALAWRVMLTADERNLARGWLRPLRMI